MEPQSNPIENIPPKPKSSKLGYLFLSLIIFIFGLVFIYKYPEQYKNLISLIKNTKIIDNPDLKTNINLKKFASDREYKSYMFSASSQMTSLFGITSEAISAPNVARDLAPVGLEKGTSLQAGSTTVDRVSETNVQVLGIDEPDMVKSDGKDIYISGSYPITYARPMLDTSVSGSTDLKTKIVSALPVESMAIKAEIKTTGDLFLDSKVLTILSGSDLIAYDVSNSSNPKEIWKQSFDQRQEIIASRLLNNKIYIATRFINSGDLCVMPLTTGNKAINLNCTDIYYPDRVIPADSVYNISKIDLKIGRIEKTSSFVGSSGLSVFYMSKNNMYITYTYFEDMIALLYKFYSTDGKGLLADGILNRIKALNTMDISVQAKLTELTLILENYKQSLSQDDLLKIETETQNKLSSYLKDNIRNFEHSGIVKINNETLDAVATGSIPGKPLNQFSLDEYQDYLRIATTVGEGATANYSLNDIYVLDGNLKETGFIKDMGEGEKIYAVRFIEDKGYLVTFKQTDPFYVLNLKDPQKPIKAGELKIPGYSSYLHKLDEGRVLGVGMDNQRVKLSVFEVSDASNPIETDKYSLDEYWSEVLNNHHAFLLDNKNKIFFIPGGKGGYIFSYEGKLSLVKAISGQGVKRALLINNYIYLISDTAITVVDESSWQLVKKIDL